MSNPLSKKTHIMTTQQKYSISGGKGSPFGSASAIIMFIVGLALLYFIAKGIFTLLYWAAPVLLIITLFMDYKVVLDYGKFILKLLKENPLMGIVGIVLTIVGYPVVSGFLFFKALMKRKIDQVMEKHKPKEEDFTEYEEVKEDFLELPEIEKTVQSNTKSGNEYDNMFE